MVQTATTFQPVSSKQHNKSSVALTAIVVYVILNVILAYAIWKGYCAETPRLMDLSTCAKEIKLIGKPTTWWIAKSYYASPNPPNIVILGSSELGAIQHADGYAFNKVIDVTNDHRSYLLEKFIHRLIGGQRKILIASLPGMMISDQLVISSALFSKDYKPELVALAFTPRDFLDNIFGQPRRSEAFAFFSRYTDLSAYESIFGAETRFDATYFSSLIPLRTLSKQFRDPFNRLCNGTQLANPFDRIRPEQILTWNLPPNPFRNDFAQYKRRYARASVYKIDKQFRSLDLLLQLLKARGIKVVAFNFPLYESNKNLISKDFWKSYDERITQICQKNGADYISLDKAVQPFKETEFVDTVHLNALGGYRLCKTLALFIANKFGIKSFQQLLAESDQCFR